VEAERLEVQNVEDSMEMGDIPDEDDPNSGSNMMTI
jgi:hypothetical protein